MEGHSRGERPLSVEAQANSSSTSNLQSNLENVGLWIQV